MLQTRPGEPVVSRAQRLLSVAQASYLMDMPNLLAVPAMLLGQPVAHLAPQDQAMAEASIEFMLRGY